MQFPHFFRGFILVKPHGTRIMTGEKTTTIKSRQFKHIHGVPLLLIEAKKALAIIILDPPQAITLQQFRRHKYKHTITEEERLKWWPRKRILWEYPITIKKIFSPPVPIDYPQGPQTLVKPENIRLKK